MTFKFNKNTPVILYGAASIGVIVARKLIQNGYNVKCFVDKRFNEMTMVEDIKVIGVNQISTKEIDECVFFVSVKNVFDHDNIVRILSSKGCTKLIYKPLLVLQGEADETLGKISLAYDSIMSNEGKELVIPRTHEIIGYKLKDHLTIKKEVISRIIYIPIELIFTNYVEGEIYKWNDINISCLYPHINFFSSLSGNLEKNFEAYLSFCIEGATKTGGIKVTESWKRNVLSNRIDVFKQMKLSYEIDPDFFIRNPATARWNSKGYFNLTGGKHRVSFLVSQAKQFIPIRISEKDYVSWFKTISLQKANSIIKQANGTLESQISHPYFAKYITCQSKWNRLSTHRFIMNLSEYLYTKLKIYDFRELTFLTQYNSIPTDLLLRLGAKECKKVDTEENVIMFLDEYSEFCKYKDYTNVIAIAFNSKVQLVCEEIQCIDQVISESETIYMYAFFRN